MIIPLIGRALGLEATAWGLAAVILFCVYLAVSVAETRRLISRALSGSSHVVWFVPAAFLLTAHSVPGTLLGLALAANATRLLISQRPPEVYSKPARGGRNAGGAEPSGAAPEASRIGGPMLAALCLQAGLCCAVGADSPVAAGAFVVAGAAVCTWCSVARGAYAPRGSFVPISLFASLALTLLLMAETPAPRQSPGPPGFLEAGLQTLRGSAGAPAPPPRAKRQIVTPLAAPRRLGAVGADGYPGAVLLPEKTLSKAFLQSASTAFAEPIRFSRALVIPFTGEYQLFPALNGRLLRGWVTYSGSPLDGLYETHLGSPMETDAYQPLAPPINRSNCGRIRVGLSNGENSLVSADLELIDSSRSHNVGTDFIGLNSAAEVTLEYEAPIAMRNHTINAIRLIFLRYGPGSAPARNAKIAVNAFFLLPDRPPKTK